MPQTDIKRKLLHDAQNEKRVQSNKRGGEEVMPLYPYLCKTCGTEAELITKHDEYPPCPDCGLKLERQFHSRFGINMGPAGARGGWDETLGHYSTNKEWREKCEKAGVKPAMSKKVWFR
uniref:Putative regulatory protein FmdB zinc ribbon domain-containing protein n=1 Tax=viral metagenome TaxID=1070528 RepID=A0A6M3IGX2_9ZZZZ